MDYNVEITKMIVLKNTLLMEMKGEVYDCSNLCKPKIVLHFINKQEDRYIPMVLQEISISDGTCHFSGSYRYKLEKLFWDTQNIDYDGVLSMDIMAEGNLINDISFKLDANNIECDSNRFSFVYEKGVLKFTQRISKEDKEKKGTIRKVVSSLLGSNTREKDDFSTSAKGEKANVSWNSGFFKKVQRGTKRAYIMWKYKKYAKAPVKRNQIAFMSQRSNGLVDNQAFVYDYLKQDKSLDIVTYLDTTPYEDTSIFKLKKFAKMCAESRVIIIDEYVPALYFLHLRKDTRFIQIWHACGAFKTVGFSRLGKVDAPIQSRRAHRNYDYSIVSSDEIRRWYAEAFGLALNKVLSLGVPRTDVFFDKEYKENVKNKIENLYPQIKGKKVILFAPTFRGGIKDLGNYPFEKTDFDELIRRCGQDYVVLIKHHPFVKGVHPKGEYSGTNVIDVTDYPDINEILFVTDLLITDYSSVIFEASLLDIPMLFFAFDLEEYIRDRDFYYDFVSFVPGKIVYTNDEIIDAIINKDFDQEKVQEFKNRFFEYQDGKSTERIGKLVKELM